MPWLKPEWVFHLHAGATEAGLPLLRDLSRSSVSFCSTSLSRSEPKRGQEQAHVPIPSLPMLLATPPVEGPGGRQGSSTALAPGRGGDRAAGTAAQLPLGFKGGDRCQVPRGSVLPESAWPSWPPRPAIRRSAEVRVMESRSEVRLTLGTGVNLG